MEMEGHLLPSTWYSKLLLNMAKQTEKWIVICLIFMSASNRHNTMADDWDNSRQISSCEIQDYSLFSVYCLKASPYQLIHLQHDGLFLQTSMSFFPF